MAASSRRLAALFVLLTVAPVTALGWVGWRLLQIERTSEAQRQRNLLAARADQFARGLDQALGAWEESLTRTDPPAGTVVLELGTEGLTARRGVPLPYYPSRLTGREAPEALFADGETAERRSQPQAAADIYTALSASRCREVRAAALVRLARTLRNQGRVTEALDAYDALAELGGVPVFGYPAELLARQQRVMLLKGASNEQAANREGALLAAALAAGRHVIDFPTFDVLRTAAPESRIDTALAEAAEEALRGWRQSASGRHAWTRDGRTFVTAWRTGPEGVVGIIGPIDVLLGTSARHHELQFSVENADGRPVWGTRGDGVSMVRRAADIGLPWTVRSAFVDPSALSQLAAQRERLLTGGLVIVLVVVAAAGYAGFRAVSHQLNVARLQSEFVATVSHEFRTPLTAMRHLSDLLEEGGVAPDRQAQYYRAIGKESRRLHSMVESLLDFGRIESGRRTYAMEDTTASDLARQVVEELGSPRVVLDTSATPSPIRGDREALSLALRNLIDNAMKYSPDASPVHVSVGAHGGFAGISVQDEGAGIPREEQRTVFRKFVRGQSARAMNVKGTGLGLTLADQIVRAHGGKLELVSEPARGARFTIRLPVHQA